jgi:hypothetical protein
MNRTMYFFVVLTCVGTLQSCGGSNSDAPVASPDYLTTDGSCLSVFSSAQKPTVGTIKDIAVYFGAYNVNLDISGEKTTFSLQSPGTATIKGVTRNITSVCLEAANGANWRRISFANSDSLNVDLSSTSGAKPCANGDNFSIDPPTYRGRFSGCKP